LEAPADVPAASSLYKVSILCNGWGLAQPKIGQKSRSSNNFEEIAFFWPIALSPGAGRSG
jgi:hypothetical protein